MKKAVMYVALFFGAVILNSCETEPVETTENDYNAIEKGTPPPANAVEKGTPPPGNG